jgi:NitT/TauT family transport system substrate-binding protein
MPVNLVELSVSHYLLARALDSVGWHERDLAGVVNTSDADMIAAFQTDDVQAVVTWNPLVSTIMESPEANMLFDSSDIPGEIIDMMVVNTETLEANPDFGRALVGAWYELMGDHVVGHRGRHRGADRHGRGLGHRSRGLRGAACLDRDVL